MYTWTKLLTGALAVSAVAVAPAWAAPKDKLKVKPDTFIDTVGGLCFDDPPNPPASPDAASSNWVNKSGTTSTPDTFGNPADFGLVLTKSVDTPICAAALARVEGPEGKTVTPATVFGYSYRNDGHCGAGAPRFNVRVTDGTQQALYVAGCSSPLPTTAPVNAFWTAATWTPAQFIRLSGDDIDMVGSQIVSVVIVFDEGTDVGPGEAILDDITFNNLVAGGPAVAK